MRQWVVLWLAYGFGSVDCSKGSAIVTIGLFLYDDYYAGGRSSLGGTNHI